MNRRTYKNIKMAGLTGVVILLVGAALFNENNNKNERNNNMSKEKKLQVPEFMKVKDVNFEPEIDICASTNSDEIAEELKERINDHYQYMDQCAKQIIEEETREEYMYGQVTVDSEMIEQSNKITQLHREKFDYIKGLSPAEQMIVLENIPINLCLTRINNMIEELQDFKSTIYDAMGNFGR